MPDDDAKPPETSSDPHAPGVFAMLRQPLTKYQSVVGIAAGLITIIATGSSLIGLHNSRTSGPGEIVATVQSARSRGPVAGATLEIVNASDAIVTTLEVDKRGRARYQLREGQYRLRVSHPQYVSDVKPVEVQSGQRAEVRLSLASRPTAAPVKQAGDGVVKFFKGLAR